MPRGTCCPLALTEEREESEREQMSALSPWKLLTAAVKDRKNECREDKRGENRRQGQSGGTEKGMWGWLRPRRVCCAERRDSECESRVWSLYLPFSTPQTPLQTSLSCSLSTLPSKSLSIMCGDSVRRSRIIPVFRAATARPSSTSSFSSSSSLSTPVTSQAWISLYHLS